jgi:D-beta-D-heptose 7-phosphate kinase / D-beta-D-heptose 1-phosphate adenosyltransferase
LTSKKKQIFVIGDSMIDVDVFGSVSRLSPEAPVPVFDISDKEEVRFGGSLKVAKHLYNFIDNVSVSYFGFINEKISRISLNINEKDRDLIFFRELDVGSCDILEKRRFYDLSYHYMFRVDYGVDYLNSEKILSCLKSVSLDEVGAVVISDYNKKCVTDEIVSYVANAAPPQCLLILDIKDTERFPCLLDSKVSSRFILKCNREEYSKVNQSITFKDEVVTAGKYGHAVNSTHYPINSSENTQAAVNTVGAGDVFTAAMVKFLLEGESLSNSCNHASKVACLKVSRRSNEEIFKSDIEELLSR